MPDTSPMLTTANIKKRLKCSMEIVYRLINQGMIPAIDISPPKSLRRTYRIDPAAFEKYLKGQGIKPLPTRRRRRKRSKLELII